MQLAWVAGNMHKVGTRLPCSSPCHLHAFLRCYTYEHQKCLTVCRMMYVCVCVCVCVRVRVCLCLCLCAPHFCSDLPPAVFAAAVPNNMKRELQDLVSEVTAEDKAMVSSLCFTGLVLLSASLQCVCVGTVQMRLRCLYVCSLCAAEAASCGERAGDVRRVERSALAQSEARTALDGTAGQGRGT